MAKMPRIVLLTDGVATGRGTFRARSGVMGQDAAVQAAKAMDVWAGVPPMVFDADPRAFHGVMPYRDGKPLSWRYSFLPSGAS